MKTVWVNGTFDVLHLGHIKLFEFAKSQGDYLIVGTDTDKRIKELKGPTRPINNEQSRREFLLAIKFIDEVYVYDSEEELISLVKNIKPDIMVWGNEYRDKRKVGVEYGKKIIYFDKLLEYSSTNIINKLYGNI
jgi:D-beta-D-heptose 7-phosphate kinase/D-beta-D-heptose 1-phosphate adenosyltransferase